MFCVIFEPQNNSTCYLSYPGMGKWYLFTFEKKSLKTREAQVYKMATPSSKAKGIPYKGKQAHGFLFEPGKFVNYMF